MTSDYIFYFLEISCLFNCLFCQIKFRIIFSSYLLQNYIEKFL